MKVVGVERHGAFSVNSAGIGRTPFPLSFSAREVAGCRVIHATAAQACELADLLAGPATGTVVVMDVATNSFFDEGYEPWTPSRIAAYQGVDCASHDLRALAKGTAGLSDEALVMRGADLPGFLAGWSPYELTVLAMRDAPGPRQLDEIALAIGTADHSRPILPVLPGCSRWYNGHDDCYVRLESADPQAARAVFGRLLALLAGSALAPAGPVNVAEPDGGVVDAVIGGHEHWTGVLGPASSGAVTVHLSAVAERWTLSHPVPQHVDHVAVYDTARASWRLDEP